MASSREAPVEKPACKLLHVVEKRLQYIKLMEKCGVTPKTEAHDQMLKEVTDGVKHSIRNTKAIDESMSLSLHELVKNIFDEATVSSIMLVVHSKVVLNYPWISSMDIIHGSMGIINGYHPWISSMDFIHGYYPWILSMDHIY